MDLDVEDIEDKGEPTPTPEAVVAANAEAIAKAMESGMLICEYVNMGICLDEDDYCSLPCYLQGTRFMFHVPCEVMH